MMATMIKNHAHPALSPPRRQSPSDRQLSRDRWTAIAVLAVLLALMSLIVWLASFGGGTVHEGVDYWHMMP